jgi:hypothetical protein
VISHLALLSEGQMERRRVVAIIEQADAEGFGSWVPGSARKRCVRRPQRGQQGRSRSHQKPIFQ